MVTAAAVYELTQRNVLTPRSTEPIVQRADRRGACVRGLELEAGRASTPLARGLDVIKRLPMPTPTAGSRVPNANASGASTLGKRFLCARAPGGTVAGLRLSGWRSAPGLSLGAGVSTASAPPTAMPRISSACPVATSWMRPCAGTSGAGARRLGGLRLALGTDVQPGGQDLCGDLPRPQPAATTASAAASM